MAAVKGTKTWLPASLSQLVTVGAQGGGKAGSEYVGGLFMSADDQRLSKLVEEKHCPDSRHLDIRPLLHLVEDIFARATHTLKLEGNEKGALTQVAAVAGATGLAINSGAAKFDTAPELPLTIERVSREMGCKCPGDPHEATLAVLGQLSHYPWEAKLVITLAAFAVNYGEFLLLSQIYSTNPLAQSITLLKQLPAGCDHDLRRRQLDAIGCLITAMLDVTKLVVEFCELPSGYVTADEPSLKAALSVFPLTVYWIIRSAVAAATHISIVASSSTHQLFMPSATELELSNWSGKLNLILDFLMKMKISVHKIIDVKVEEEAYNKLCMTFFKMVHQDNLTVIKSLIYSKDDALPLFDGTTKKRVQLDVLRGKTVLLLITSLHDRLTILENIYKESKIHAYNIVWVPVVDRSTTWNTSMQSRFEELQSTMPWYSVYHPSILGGATTRFFHQGLNFTGKPTLVSLDTQGKITSMNALHMMWIWKNDAFPFTRVREEALWKHESLRLELLVANIDQTISNWVKEDKYIFVYGGEDIDWIRKFTKAAKVVSAAGKINLELVYVGKSCKRETVRQITKIMEAEKLGYYIKDINSMNFFWTRLESMLHSKIQLEMVDDDSDKVTLEIKKIISYDKNVGGWAVICKGSQVLASVSGRTIYEVLVKYEEWKVQVDVVGGGFHVALLDKIASGGPDHTCFRLEFPAAEGKVPQAMKCPECRKHMQDYVTFVCCHDGRVRSAL